MPDISLSAKPHRLCIFCTNHVEYHTEINHCSKEIKYAKWQHKCYHTDTADVWPQLGIDALA